MPAVKMNRLTLVGLAEDQAAIIDTLLRLGAVEIDAGVAENQAGSASSLIGQSQQLQQAMARLQAVIEYCRHHDPAASKLGSARRPVSRVDFLAAGEHEQAIMRQVSQFEGLQTQIQLLRQRLMQDEVTRGLLLPWQKLELDLATQATAQTRLFIGAFSGDAQLLAFTQAMQDEAPETHIEIIDRDDSTIRCVIMTLHIREYIVLAGLRRFSFNPLPVQNLAGTPAQLLASLAIRQAQTREELARNEADLLLLAAGGIDFELLYDVFLLRNLKLQARQQLPATASTFYLTGWVPGSACPKVQKTLQAEFLVALDYRPPQSDEIAPVFLRNHPLVQPFEVVVEMYSPPSAADIDPSPLLAPYFFFFFGMMLSDVGYGLILTALCGWLAFKKKAGGEMGRLSRMLFLSGIGAIIWGLLFGGFFGDLLTVVSQGRLVVPSFWFNPMEDPIKLMIWSMLFGVLHLFTGMGARIYLLARAGRLRDALLDIAPWYLIISGLGLMIGAGSLGPAINWFAAGQYLALAGTTVILLFGGRPAKNPILRLGKGLLALYNITGYFSDILSYTRILALVLATSVIAMVVNLLGFMGGPTPLGYLGFTITALLGHTLNLALSALSAYVHTSRLHYVEFFGKFYEGGGRLWQPLQARTRYVEISKNE